MQLNKHRKLFRVSWSSYILLGQVYNRCARRWSRLCILVIFSFLIDDLMNRGLKSTMCFQTHLRVESFSNRHKLLTKVLSRSPPRLTLSFHTSNEGVFLRLDLPVDALYLITLVRRIIVPHNPLSTLLQSQKRVAASSYK